MQKESHIIRHAANESGVKDQFGERASRFNWSAEWVMNNDLLGSIVQMVEKPVGTVGLDLCCGTGRVSWALEKGAGLDMRGIDITPAMVEQSGRLSRVTLGNVENLPFADNSFDFIDIRQALFLTDSNKTLNEVHRVLKPGGQFIVCNVVPVNNDDEEYLKKIHLLKQPQLKQFYTSENLKQELCEHGFIIQKNKFLVVRESIDRWMCEQNAPELAHEIREEVLDMVQFAPKEYRDIRHVKRENGHTMENWGWQIYSVTVDKNNPRINL